VTENPIALIIAENPVLALTDKEKFAEFMKDIKAEIDAHVPDISTPKGRAEISSLAYKVTRSKTAIDKAGKELNAGKRKEIDAVDAERRAIWDRLDALATEVRKPLTEWEQAETLRQEKIAEILDAISGISFDPKSSAHIQEKIDFLNSIEIDPEIFQDRLSDAIIAKKEELDALETALASARQYETDQIELAELRAQKERQEIADRERLEKEAAERAERDRIAQAAIDKANREKVELEASIAAEKADREAEEAARIQADKDAIRAKAELEARELARQQEIADAADRARQAEIDKARAEQVERDRLAQIEIDKANREAEALRQAEDARLANERAEKSAQDARDKDRKHRGEVMKAAKEAMMELGASEDVAKKIVLAIVAGEVPNVRLVF
jgi:colicin import membrane protein